MVDYFYSNLSGPLPIARWKSVESFPVGKDIKSTYIEELNKYQIFFSEKEDELLWIHSKLGGYLVKDGYRFLSSSSMG